MQVQISIHDVMPQTLDETAVLLDQLAGLGAGPVQLLVVPGLDWNDAGIARLAAWQQEGHELVGHGWRHKARHIRGLYHRLHALLISRDVAEHLALGEDEICALITDNHRWFADRGLVPPKLYVPPAWALGRLSRAACAALPVERIEITSGTLDCRTGRRERQYLVGFEADTRWRKWALKAFNTVNVALARRRGRTLRVAIHPHDPGYLLAGDIPQMVRLPAAK